MIIILGIFLGVLAVAGAITVVALRRAKDGYEDASGFHFVDPVGARPPAVEVGWARPAPMVQVASHASEDALRVAHQLPSELLGAR